MKSLIPVITLLLGIVPVVHATCEGNVLAGATPLGVGMLTGDPGALTDGVATQEGAQWDSPQAAILGGVKPSLVFDLKTPQKLAGAYIQADGNDDYQFAISADGENYTDVWQAGFVQGHGLKARQGEWAAMSARYLRITPSGGDGYYSISEIQAFCDTPKPSLKVVQVTPAVVKQPWWNDVTSTRWEWLLAGLGLALVLWRPTQAEKRWKDRGYALLGIVSFATYFNFGSFHFNNFIHNWDSFHYYAGAKYFRELQYDRLYRCVAWADAEESSLRPRVMGRRLTNLQTNEMEIGSDVLADPGSCKTYFTEGRWREFKHDVAFFRAREGAQRWEDLSTDHGYNATPVWTIAGHLLTNSGPITLDKLYWLAYLDPLYLIAACLMIGWAFGWRVMAVAIAVLATNFPARFYWTGGSILRWDWLFYLTASICLMRKQHFLLAGAALAYATLLRIFPGFVVVAALLAVGAGFMQTRRLDTGWKRFILGGIVTTALLVPLSVVVCGSTEVYSRFIYNTQKHKETPLTNHMGLRTVMSYKPDQVGRYLRDGSLLDPWSRWKQARLDTFEDRKLVYGLFLLGYLVLLYAAVRRQPHWVALALGTTLIPMGVELTSYYYSFVLATAVLAAQDRRAGPALLLMTFLSGFFAAAPLPGMSGWFDEIYTWMSAVTVGVFMYLCWRFAQAPSGTMSDGRVLS